MINAAQFLTHLEGHGVTFFCGVPDSLLKAFCAEVQTSVPAERHIITANEGNAVALAIGHYLGSGSPGLVYLQNSGLGNIVNPLTSLADPEVYKVPMLILIGWRGEPGVKDEPQHVKQGRITERQLETLEVPHWVLDADGDWKAAISDACAAMVKGSKPVALLVRGGAFEEVAASFPSDPRYPMRREAAIARVLEGVGKDALVVASTGHISREVYETRIKAGLGTERDFLTVGGMGHTASIALGLALARKDRKVICMDGDGSLIMHMGMMPIIAAAAPQNLLHVVVNNGAHDSVGGQPTVALDIDIPAIALANGYQRAWSVSDDAGLDKALVEALALPGPVLLEIRVAKGARKDLGRPKSTPLQNRESFMKALGLGV
jgi:phosphonopyruvate decarboxylase